MTASKEDVARVAAALGYAVAEGEVDDYVILLGKAKAALEAVDKMDDYQPEPHYDLSPRQNVHLPERQDNPHGAWAYRCDCVHAKPSSDLLSGKTVCLKDNIAMAGVPCLLGTDTFTGWTPTTDATVVTRILAHGGTISGKAVCENLSRGAVSCTAASGPVDNPYAKGYSAGGSSSGTAALVASGAADIGIGCDQGGSIRIPAALCGLYGFKATTGLVPYTGIASNDASVDYVGPVTKTALDCARLLQAIAGVDGLDDRQIAGVPFLHEVPKYGDLVASMDLSQGLKGVTMGILKEGLESPFMDAGVKEKFYAAVEVFQKLGVVVKEVSVPIHAQGRTVYTVMSKMSNHMGMLGRSTGRRQVMLTDLFERKNLPYTQEVLHKMNMTSKEGLFAGELGWSDYPLAYPKSVNIMRKIRDLYDETLKEVDFLIMPTTVTPSNPYPKPDATPLQQADASLGKLENTCSFNGSGHPALAMPIGLVPSKEDPDLMLPASLQIVGKFWDELNMLKAAYAWEQAQD
ncbi:amidase signature domain-containing protein [Microdochium trichocladiopsis]|uniref:Amidase signature domain-containing protein n=1 Tax=Microdochium trichocladiopsis TaxID=1682393 RepID=A0A9P8XYL6_9PEZI|nr:amidase signature domain-containing protein [Microdochium trichocladiopsis]KAH7024949.1 amidase signature domain-containing protein [Microdochium trichocladiopsis]